MGMCFLPTQGNLSLPENSIAHNAFACVIQPLRAYLVCARTGAGFTHPSSNCALQCRHTPAKTRATHVFVVNRHFRKPSNTINGFDHGAGGISGVANMNALDGGDGGKNGNEFHVSEWVSGD